MCKNIMASIACRCPEEIASLLAVCNKCITHQPVTVCHAVWVWLWTACLRKPDSARTAMYATNTASALNKSQ
jgi:hypothetical protein